MQFDSRITDDLKRVLQGLHGAAKLPSREQLATYYAAFRDRFGPERLRALDGELLLETMHHHGTHDSLVYWLEFKNDEELPARFGGIGGGSALKFGIYRRAKTGEWMTGSPTNQRAMSVAEAVDRAREHRDQLLLGCDFLSKFPENPTADDYQRLQEFMDQEAPALASSAWGHKYFSLIFPTKLDDYHSFDWQRFFLIKLLQFPPATGKRYEAACGFITLARQLDLPMNWLSAALDVRNGRPHRYWKITPGQAGDASAEWKAMRDGGFAAINWAKLGDLSSLAGETAVPPSLKDTMAAQYPNVPQWVGRDSAQVFRFVARMQQQDIIVVGSGDRAFGIGRVVGDYEHAEQSELAHRRRVEWLACDEWQLPEPDEARTWVHELDSVDTLIDIERRMLGGGPRRGGTDPPPPPRPELAPIAKKIEAALERKGQVILYGPPGTGKTYWAEIAARELAAREEFGRPFESLTSDEKARIIGGPAARVRFCCFHPAYGYEDFIEGYRPEERNDEPAFVLQRGVFRALCDDACDRSDRMFYLIIDEINRGDIPRIFGELLMMLERNKRGKPMLLPLSGQTFHVPANVRVIGTMNTADRSIALLDTALRRRFAFIELMPDSSVLQRAAAGKVPLGVWLDGLNARIRDCIGRDARNRQIGHSYLLDSDKAVTNFSRFARIVQEDIIPLIEEYCYEDYETMVKILGSGIVDAHQQRINHELFEPGADDQLLMALLAVCPEIATEPEVTSSELSPLDDDVRRLEDEKLEEEESLPTIAPTAD